MEVVQAKLELSRTKGGAFQPYEDPDSPEPTLPPVRERRAANAILNSKVREHILVPVTQALGHTAIEDRAACIIHEHAIEADDHHHTNKLLDSYESFIVDLGTEANTPDFRISRADITQLMPPWMVQRQPVLEAERLDEDDGQPRMRYQCDDHGMFLRNAIPIPGINHCMHSVVKSAREHVSHYDTFFLQLKTLQTIIVNRGRNARLVATCFLNTVHEPLRHHVEGFSIVLHEPRWGGCDGILPSFH